jgi:hypothetical protein
MNVRKYRRDMIWPAFAFMFLSAFVSSSIFILDYLLQLLHSETNTLLAIILFSGYASVGTLFTLWFGKSKL